MIDFLAQVNGQQVEQYGIGGAALGGVGTIGYFLIQILRARLPEKWGGASTSCQMTKDVKDAILREDSLGRKLIHRISEDDERRHQETLTILRCISESQVKISDSQIQVAAILAERKH